MAIRANIQIPSKGNTTTVTQSTQSITVAQNSPNQVSILDRQSIAGIQGAADKHKALTINVNDWVQNGAQYEVELTHSLNKFPSVTIIDSFNQTMYPDVEYISENTAKIIVRAQFSGKAYFN
jgi:hypothetical protein